jgi:hypothetical protein
VSILNLTILSSLLVLLSDKVGGFVQTLWILIHLHLAQLHS